MSIASCICSSFLEISLVVLPRIIMVISGAWTNRNVAASLDFHFARAKVNCRSMEDLMFFGYFNTARANTWYTCCRDNVQGRLMYAPSGHDVTTLATNSSSILEILVGLTKSRVSRPRSIEERESSLCRAARKTADSISLIANEFLLISASVILRNSNPGHNFTSILSPHIDLFIYSVKSRCLSFSCHGRTLRVSCGVP